MKYKETALLDSLSLFICYEVVKFVEQGEDRSMIFKMVYKMLTTKKFKDFFQKM
ncbi:hypothetical protein [Chryseobacterium bernardetii]|uniref:hypothetical protein n=1 Tax=Chryseobacterium bernardetii TaxID=1241978 RepID=UPI0013DE3FE2|nr:hypothetical protein [Chryseobacterium bernardetii]